MQINSNRISSFKIFQGVVGLALFLSWCLVGCTRAANTGSSQINIVMPSSSEKKTSATASADSKFSSKPSFDTSKIPTTYDQVSCLFVMVGGPEESMHHNFCGKTTTAGTAGAVTVGTGTNAVSFSNLINFGVFAATFGKDQMVSLEVPSGTDRFIRIYGMYMPSGTTRCPQIIPGNSGTDALLSGFSPPVYLGEAGSLNLAPGATVTVPINISSTIDATNYFDDCGGPDFGGNPGGGGSGGSPGGNSSQPYLRLEGLWQFMHWDSSSSAPVHIKPITTEQCLPVSLKLYTPGGTGIANPYVLTANLNIGLPLSSEVEFHTVATCSDTAISNVTLAAGSSQSPNLFAKFKFVGPSYEVRLNLSTTEVKYSSDGAYDVGKPVLRFNFANVGGGNTDLVINHCYPFKAQTFEADGITPLNTTISSAQFAGTGATHVYSTTSNDNKTCSTAISLFSISGSTESPIMYYQTAGVVAEAITPSGAQVTSLNVLPSNLVQATVSGLDPTAVTYQLPPTIEVNKCIPIKVNLKSGNHFVPAQSNFVMDLGLSSGYGNFYLNPDCSGYPFRPIQQFPQEFGWNTGDWEKVVFFKALTPIASTTILLKNTPAGIRPSAFTTSGTFAIAGSASPAAAQFTSVPDFFKPDYITSLDFGGPGTSVVIPMSVASGATITCRREQNSSDCTNLIIGAASFQWPFAEANLDYKYWFDVKTATGSFYTFSFQPSNFFGQKQYMDCSSRPIITGTVTTTAVSGTGLYCVDHNAIININTGSSLNLTNVDLIGTTDMSSTINVTNSGYVQFVAPTVPSHMANIKVQSSSTASTAQLVNVTSSGSQVWIDNVYLGLNGAASAVTAGIKVGAMTSTTYLINISGSTSTAGTISPAGMIKLQGPSNSTTIRGVDFTNTVIGSMAGIYINDVTAASTTIQYYKFVGIDSGIFLNNGGGATDSTLSDAHDWNLVSNGGSSPTVNIGTHLNLHLTDSYLEKNGGSTYVLQSTGAVGNYTFNNTTFVQGNDYNAIALGTQSVIGFRSNQFLLTAASSASKFPIYTTVSTFINSDDTPSSSTNLYCTTTNGSAWDSTYRLGTSANTGNFNRTNSYSGAFSGVASSENNRCLLSNP